MNHCVPDFNMEDTNYSISSANRSKKSTMPEDDIMELLWHNGQLVTHSQRPVKNNNNHNIKSAPNSTSNNKSDDAVLRTDQHHQLFMQEDEMASWLHYPLNDCNFVDSSDFCADLLYNTNPTPCVTTSTDPPIVRPPQSARPPIPPPSKSVQLHNFPNFSRRPQACSEVQKSTTVVDSNVTPPRELRINNIPCPTLSCGGAAAVSTVGTSSNNVGREVVDVTVTSSPGCSSGSAEPILKHPSAEMRKRKGKDTTGDDGDYHCEDVEFEPPDSKKQNRGSSSTKRSRAAEVHNLSERRRRDRINEKMKALQELIPRCNKSDKASMLDEAIEYLKSLQLQVQMMSMGCGMVPMMFPGVQQYMAPMGMRGFGMGMGMDMGMGMARPMLPFPNALQSPNAAAAHLSPRFPMPPFHIPTNQADPLLNTLGMQNPNQPRNPNFQDPAHQQYMGPHQMQLPLQQHLTMAQPSTNKPSSSKIAKNNDKQQ